jgi:hypothetical protein
MKSLFGTVQERPFDPAARFGDPLAATVEWTAASSGGASFRDRQYCQVTQDLVHFRRTYEIYLLGLFGISFMLVFVFVGIVTDSLVFSGFGIAGVIFFICASGYESHEISFNRRAALFSRGRRRLFFLVEPGAEVRLTDIHALQLIAKRSGFYGSDTWPTYELNLVLGDGSRENVVDHGDETALTADAQRLAQFLGVPLWINT